MPDRNAFAVQLKRLYDRRGMDFKPAQAKAYWDVLGQTDKGGDPIFSDAEIQGAIERALMEPPPAYGIPDVNTLRAYILQERSNTAARQRRTNDASCTPEGLEEFGRTWRQVLGGQS
jgi:hypothetical protein